MVAAVRFRTVESAVESTAQCTVSFACALCRGHWAAYTSQKGEEKMASKVHEIEEAIADIVQWKQASAQLMLIAV